VGYSAVSARANLIRTFIKLSWICDKTVATMQRWALKSNEAIVLPPNTLQEL
jgi:hypothetical protein